MSLHNSPQSVPEKEFPMSRLAAISAASAVCVLLGGTALYVTVFAAKDANDCRGGQVAGSIGGPFTLTDQAGKTVTDKDVIAKPALIYFGYTFCPDVCPVDNARNAEAVDILAEQGYDVTPVFITIDPARDTTAVMADYAANMHPKMIALTGTPEQIDVASKAYRTYYRKQDGDDEFYMMDHTTFTYFALPGTGFADVFERETTPLQMATRVACFLSSSPAT
jgi:protein SCO1